ncbi:MAG: PspC domain-containing protein [bacterium]|nr:MAG: PspC domain-containing protein [bacterium]
MSEKKLYRSRDKRVIGGVCGGLADYFSLDVTLIRLLWAAAILLAGTGFFLYLSFPMSQLILLPKDELQT